MELLILNTKFETVDVLDVFESLIWTDRFFRCGDFEIYTTTDIEIVQKLKLDYYLQNAASDHMMIIESAQIKADVENGSKLIVKGRSLESILDRRIIWNQTILDGYLEAQIEKLLNENVINPAISARKISNFRFEKSGDPFIEGLKIQAQYTGDNLYDVICNICKESQIGFKVIYEEDTNFFVFKLYSGTNRSYSQDKNPFVVFSPDFNNIINTDYVEGKKDLKTVALVAGEGEGSARRKVITGKNEDTELIRRELFVDARDISSSLPNGATLSTSQYDTQLIHRGNERLEENKMQKAFNGQVETTQMYRYDEHFFMGDIVQLENEFGMADQSRVIEFIFSDSRLGGSENYPTFEVVEETV